MIYRCHACGWRIHQRQNVLVENIGTHVFFEQRRFCDKYCVELWQYYYPSHKNRNRPDYAPISDWDEPQCMRERKINRLPRLKNRHFENKNSAC